MVFPARLFLFACLMVMSAHGAVAQLALPQIAPKVQAPPSPMPVSASFCAPGFTSNQWRLEGVTATHWRLTGQVEVECDRLKFFADEVELFTDTDRLVASGNVVFTNPEGRISAERVDFDTRNLVGTFYRASGIMSLGPKADLTQFAGQDPDVYFYGDLIEKVADKKYRLTGGAFTTCVQPTPRWELVSSSVTINLDDYAVLRNSVLRVKGVPLMYLPYAYYPLQEDQRATGFLLPTYGASSLKGQAISNAFFWAITRSQDATVFHDWFTKTGQGTGGEYRYIAGQGSDGTFRSYLFSQRATTFTLGNGRTTALPKATSFELTGNATQSLGAGLRARARIDYFSNVTSQQLYHANIYEASRRLRVIGGSVNGNWGPYSISSVYQRSEAFEGTVGSTTYGAAPRITGTVAPRELFGAPIYAGTSTEYAYLLYRDTRGPTPVDRGMARMDLMPTVRVPFSKLTFLTVNSSAAYRLTHYSRSLDERERQIDTPLTRSYLSVRSDVVGPVFTRIFNTPNSRMAERFKHVIEPTFGFEQTTGIDNYRNVVILTDTSDFIVGGLTRLTYGLTNRLMARSRPGESGRGQAREILTATMQQTYYANPEGSQYDINYASSQRGRIESVSPVALIVRGAPTSTTDTTMRMEYDLTGRGLQIFSLSSSASFRSQSVSGSWSRRKLDSRSPTDSYLTANTSLRFNQGRTGGTYAVSWDAGRGYVVSQGVTAFYNAQCCGVGFEYQYFNYPQTTAFPLPSDRRINFSLMLAGLGTFQNFFGAFGGPR